MSRKSPGQWEGGKPPAHVVEYVEWLVLPESLRGDIKTKADWAREKGFNRKTLNDWENDDRVRWLIRDRADALNMSPERIQEAMNALYRKATSGDVQALKLYLDHVDKIMPREKAAEAGFEDMSDEDLAELAKEVLSGNSLHA